MDVSQIVGTVLTFAVGIIGFGGMLASAIVYLEGPNS